LADNIHFRPARPGAGKAIITRPPVTAPVSAARPELETMYRIGLAVQRIVRGAAGSPHRGDVVAMSAAGAPTEELDRLAEREVLRTLELEGVDWNVVSEEIGVVDRGGARTLVVDPIDGTSNALRQFPFSSLSLGLGGSDLESIDVGLVRDLDRGTTYWAERGRGAFRDGRPIRTRARRPKGEVVLLNLGTHASERAVRLAARTRRVRSLGCASLELMMVAQGAADAYLFENTEAGRNLRATDIAGAYRIVLEAGGGLSTAAGEPLGPFPLRLEDRTSVFAWGDAELGRAFARGGFP
jgi:fructose-1,6-bisphosphatase/inositol monophosphatase family enzyme